MAVAATDMVVSVVMVGAVVAAVTVPAVVVSVVMTACVMAGAMVMAMVVAVVRRLCLSSQRHEQRGCDCGNECETSQQVFHSYLHRFSGGNVAISKPLADRGEGRMGKLQTA